MSRVHMRTVVLAVLGFVNATDAAGFVCGAYIRHSAAAV